MSDAARLARLAYEKKPKDVSYNSFVAPSNLIQNIRDKLKIAIVENAYASLISYIEAVEGLKRGSSSWGVVRLYYSSYYSIKAMLISGDLVPFNAGREMMLDVSSGKFFVGGSSSHIWKWESIRKALVGYEWFVSQDSEEAYGKLRKHRENVSYTHCFTDPDIHKCLSYNSHSFIEKFKIYRDDDKFIYTYLDEHLSFAYPTKLIFELEKIFKEYGLEFDNQRVRHIKSLWKIGIRCPLT